MSVYFDKLTELKKRAEQLSYNDKKELDDLKRKSKMCVENMFPLKPTYTLEVDKIQFHPSYWVDGMGTKVYTDAWENGKQELVNFLDTRIEEARIEIDHTIASPKDRTVIKEVFIKDQERVFELQSEVSKLEKKQRLWNKVDYTLIFTIIGGAFALGYYFGNHHFDNEKIQLYNENQSLKKNIDSLYLIKSERKINKPISTKP